MGKTIIEFISSEVMPEMYEYERTETTVVNSYIRPVVSKYVESLHNELDRKAHEENLRKLGDRSA